MNEDRLIDVYRKIRLADEEQVAYDDLLNHGDIEALNDEIENLYQSEREWIEFQIVSNNTNEKLSEQNQHYRNLLKSLSDTHDIASKIMKKHPAKKIIDANDLLQYILRKINDELERGTE